LSLSNAELDAIYLTIALASITTVLLLILGTPLAWWLSRLRAEHVSGPVLARADGFAAGVQFQRFSHRLGDLLLALCGATTADRI
jgi:ABC-type Fe3+ transport system permease subunit